MNEHESKQDTLTQEDEHKLIAERREAPPPWWIKPIILLSIPWAISIHTVTAFLYTGLAGRPFWNAAILAPRVASLEM